MKSYPANIARPRAIPLFHAVPVRDRHDGWTPRRQAAFIGHLAETRSVSEAARRVEMARESAYQLRRRPGAGSFCAAWDGPGCQSRTARFQTSHRRTRCGPRKWCGGRSIWTTAGLSACRKSTTIQRF
jgi:hypothetical protein